MSQCIKNITTFHDYNDINISKLIKIMTDLEVYIASGHASEEQTDKYMYAIEGLFCYHYLDDWCEYASVFTLELLENFVDSITDKYRKEDYEITLLGLQDYFFKKCFGPFCVEENPTNEDIWQTIAYIESRTTDRTSNEYKEAICSLVKYGMVYVGWYSIVCPITGDDIVDELKKQIKMSEEFMALYEANEQDNKSNIIDTCKYHQEEHLIVCNQALIKSFLESQENRDGDEDEYYKWCDETFYNWILTERSNRNMQADSQLLRMNLDKADEENWTQKQRSDYYYKVCNTSFKWQKKEAEFRKKLMKQLDDLFR